jgi:hypothetical protein
MSLFDSKILQSSIFNLSILITMSGQADKPDTDFRTTGCTG